MSQLYSYTAKDARGKTIKGFLTADSEVELANKISNMGYFMTGFKSAQAAAQPTKFKTYRMKPREVLQFTFHLNCISSLLSVPYILESGIPVCWERSAAVISEWVTRV